MTPATHDLEIWAGATWPGFSITCMDPGTGDAMDLTGWSAQAAIVRTGGRLTTSGARAYPLAPSIPDPATGIVTLPEIDRTSAATLLPGHARWDLVLIDPEGKRLGPYLAGTVLIKAIVTPDA